MDIPKDNKSINSKACFLYSFNHAANPFTKQCINTLVGNGYSVTVYDGADVKINNDCYVHKPLGGGRINAHFRYYWLLKMAVLTLLKRYDVVIASMPDVLFIGWLLKKITRASLIYYPFELWGDEASRYSTEPTLNRIESWLLRKEGVLDALVTQNEQRASVYRDERNASVEPTIIRNFKLHRNVEKANKLSQIAGISANKKIVLYEGAIQESRCIPELIASVEFFPNDAVLAIMGPVYGPYETEFSRSIEGSPFREKIFVLPSVPHDQLHGYIADADVGVAIYTNKNRNNYFCAPGKFSDYVLAGVPIASPAYPSIRQVIERYNIGVCYERVDPKLIGKAIQAILSKPKEEWRASLEKASQELVWETQEQALLDCIKRRY